MFRSVVSFIVIILTLHCYVVSAQQLNFTNYSMEHGLAGSTVYDMLQDSKGYIWMGTNNGLSRFNGISFKNYEIKNGAVDNTISCLAMDKQGNIWCGTAQEGVFIFDGKNFLDISDSIDLPNNNIHSILSTKEGDIWIGAFEYLIRIRHSKLKPQNVDIISEIDGQSFEGVTALMQDKNNEIWIGMRGAKTGGYFRFDGVTFKSQEVLYRGSSTVCMVISLFEDSKLNVWAGTWASRTSITRNNKSTIIDYDDIELKAGKSIQAIWAINEDKYGTIWFGTNTGGIWTNSDGRYSQIAHTDGEIIYSILRDREENLWFGTEDKGVRKLSAIPFVKYDIKDGVSNNNVTSVRAYEDYLWIGTDGGGANKIEFKPYNNLVIEEIAAKEGVHDIVWDIYEDAQRKVWFATDCEINTIDGQHLDTINVVTNDGQMVYSILEDRSGDVWFGSRDVGAIRVSGEEVEYFSVESGDLLSNTVRDIVEDKDGNLWFATSEGLSKYDGREFYHKTIKDGLPDKYILTLEIDHRKNMWVGCNSGGLLLYDGKNFIQFSKVQGLPSNSIQSLIRADTSTLWIGTKKGLVHFDLDLYYNHDSIVFRIFEQSDGFTGIACNNNAMFYDRENVLWIGTAGGLFSFDTEKFHPNMLESIVHIESARLFNDAELEDNYPRLKHNKNLLTFEFIGVSHTNPGKVKYRYRLSGLDEKWSNPTFERSVTFALIPPDKYVFEVISSNNEGRWNAEPAQYRFEILNPYWEELWFKSMITAGLLSITLLIIYYLFKRQRKKGELEREISELQIKSIQRQTDSHFTFNIINSIGSLFEKKDTEKANYIFGKYTKILRSTVLSSDNISITLSQELEDVENYLVLEQFRLNDKFDYGIQIDKSVNMDIPIPKMLIHTFVENAVKHGIKHKDGEGTIRISVRKNNFFFNISIEDDGIGRKRARELSKQSTGQGMRILDEILRLYSNLKKTRISYDVKDLLDDKGKHRGTLVNIRIPSKSR